MWSGVVLLAVVAAVGAVTRDQFYPHGAGIDQRLPRGAEVASPEIPLKVPITLFGQTYDTIFVNNYGVLSFRAEISSFINAEFPLPYPAIAAFYSNIDTSESGYVYYRESNDSFVLSKAEESVQDNFHDYYDFIPTSVFIATWIDVTYTGNQRSDRKNSFQVAVINNGTESFVELLYPEREIQWIQREVSPDNLPDAKAQAGFISEDGQIFNLRGSGSHQIRNIISWSNTHEPGKYVFHIGMIPVDSTIAVPDQYDEHEEEIQEESKTCAQSGPSVCHLQARCVDYQAGICCECNEGFYGNGKSCIRNDVPIRVHGKLNGVINNANLNDVDIQAYVVVAEGRSYTAISQVPATLGNSFQLISVLGGVVGWLFAKPFEAAKNGYQLTSALFNHTADIYFPATEDRITINQEYLGHDVFDQITIDVDIRGTIPNVQPGTKLEVSEYEEQYTTVEAGLIRSSSTRVFTNKNTGQTYEQRVLQTFTFNSCKFAPAAEADNEPLTLKVLKNYLGYETKENIVRYGTTNKITSRSQKDPCVEGRNSCDARSTCVVNGDSFDCICPSGFSSITYENTHACIDINECEAGTHNCNTNADCYNHDGGFQCRCRDGYEGNGVSCTVPKCKNEICDPNAYCNDHPAEQTACVCRPGFTGDGQRCWPITQNLCDNCSPYARCGFVSNFNTYACICNDGYTGNGYDCTEAEVTPVSLVSEPTNSEDTIDTTTSSSATEALYNETYVLPSCNVYECICPPGYSKYKDERYNDLCRLNSMPDVNSASEKSIGCNDDTDCPPNAICSFSSEYWSEEKNNGHCVCPEGYEGDAYECIEHTGGSCSCEQFAHCIDIGNGELMCVCDTGYHGDGHSCRPNFSCNNNSDCEYNAECRLDINSSEYVCQCVEGYVKDQSDACVADKQLCNGAICADHASCVFDSEMNVNYCLCDPGYEGVGITSCLIQGRTCDVANDCSPYGVCVQAELSYQCVCRDGYEGDGYICNPEMSCKTNHYLCDVHASCLKTSDGYGCECNSGYSGNGSYCELNPTQAGNFLVVSSGAAIYRAPFQVTARDFATPLNSAVYQTAVAIDVDCLSGRIYWSDVFGNMIKRASYDGSGFEQFLSYDVKDPEGISIDWVARNIFWTDSRKLTIEVLNIDTKVRKVLFEKDGISNPRGIAVHPGKGKIFWSDWNRSSPKIEWANMDGSQRGVFLDQSEVKLPNSLAIDWSRNRLCYADAGLFSIRCVGIDTNEREIIATNCSYPFSLTINGNKFYWTDWRTLNIQFIDTVTQEKGQVPIATASRKLYGVAVAPDQCLPQSNVCQYRNGNCEPNQLCLPDGQGSRTCVYGDNDIQK